MSYLVLARKYRPQTFEEIIGQDHVAQTLTNAISAGRVPHAILFSGPRGTGKTTVARILAKAMNCEKGPAKIPCNVCRSCVEITSGNAADVFEIDGASNNSVDQVRELRSNIKYMPVHSRYKIYIIDEVHMLSVAAFNALLKTLEEPPEHIMFMMATTEPHKIPMTILSRCQKHDLKRIDIESINGHLKDLCTRERVSIDDESLAAIAREGAGSMRDALSLLDQVMAFSEDHVTHEKLIDILGLVDRKHLFDISRAVFEENIPGILEIFEGIYERGHDVKKLYGDIIAHFRNLMVVKMGEQARKLVDLPKNEIDRLALQVKDASPTYLNQILDFLFNSESSIRYSDQPRLALELVFIRLMQVRPALPIDVLIEKLDHLRNDLKIPDNGRTVNDKSQAAAGGPACPPEGGMAVSATPEPDPAGDVPEKAGRGEERDLEKIWGRLFDRIQKDHPSIAASLTNSRLKDLTAGEVVIEVNGNSFNISMIRREKNMAVLQEVCDTFFAGKMKVILDEKESENDLRRQNIAVKNLKQEALNHPLVSDVVEIFKGKIVDVELL
jgi:DNA polymerase-3 subunit gamma/tau